MNPIRRPQVSHYRWAASCRSDRCRENATPYSQSRSAKDGLSVTKYEG